MDVERLKEIFSTAQFQARYFTVTFTNGKTIEIVVNPAKVYDEFMVVYLVLKSKEYRDDQNHMRREPTMTKKGIIFFSSIASIQLEED